MEWVAWAFFGLIFLAVTATQVFKIIILERNPLPYRYDDGGRKASGFQKEAGDCVTRAIAIATGYRYIDVYQIVDRAGKNSGYAKNSADEGVNGYITDALMDAFNGVWYGTPSGTYLNKDSVPSTGILIANTSGHVVAIIDGVAYDNHTTDVRQELFGYWVFPDRRKR